MERPFMKLLRVGSGPIAKILFINISTEVEMSFIAYP
jgi:hypothetical protein